MKKRVIAFLLFSFFIVLWPGRKEISHLTFLLVIDGKNQKHLGYDSLEVIEENKVIKDIHSLSDKAQHFLGRLIIYTGEIEGYSLYLEEAIESITPFYRMVNTILKVQKFPGDKNASPFLSKILKKRENNNDYKNKGLELDFYR